MSVNLYETDKYLAKSGLEKAAVLNSFLSYVVSPLVTF